MKKNLLLVLFLFSAVISKGTIHVITNSGFTFVPMSIQILAGDTVDFQIGGSHNVVEVTSATWIVNQNTPIGGGFMLPFGGGMLQTAGFNIQTYYYVCSPHANFSMKGTIEVIGTVGINETRPAWSISAAPNPFDSKLVIETHGIDEIVVYNMAGRQVHTIQLVHGAVSHAFNAKGLARGIYFFRFIRNDAVVETRKIVRH